MAKKALGKGLGALIRPQSSAGQAQKSRTSGQSGQTKSPDASKAGKDEKPDGYAALENIVPSPLQPRKHFSEAQIEELQDSISQHGIIQPLIVREVNGKLELIAGERRWRASKALGLDEVPIRVLEASDRDVLEMALIENIQRKDLDPIEEAQGYVRLAKEFELKQDTIAKRVGKSRASVANAMRLMELDPSIQDHVAQSRLSVGHAKAILGVKVHEEQCLLADQILKKSLTVRAAEKLVKEFATPTKTGKAKANSSEADAVIKQIQSALRDRFATEIQMNHSSKKGKIEIAYYGNDDLQRILDLLGIKL